MPLDNPPPLLPRLRTLLQRPLSRLPSGWPYRRLLPLAGTAALAGAGLWWLTVAGTAPAGEPGGRAAGRRAAADIRRALGTVAADTPRATAALAAGRAHLDSARAHARRAILHHQQAASPHAPAYFLPYPAAADTTAAARVAAARRLQRQLAGH